MDGAIKRNETAATEAEMRLEDAGLLDAAGPLA
jgi:hypothetical protein